MVPALERAEIPYMLTGSVASSIHGTPRSTADIDIVIAPTRAQLITFVRQFPDDRYYADEQQALSALANRSQFNVIELATGWKTDFIIVKDSDYARTAMSRRALVDFDGTPVYVSSPEDVIVAKLQWAKLTHSDRQMDDVRGILRAQRDKLDFAYIENWVRELRVESEWQNVRDAR